MGLAIWQNRSKQDRILDLVGLILQGFLVPAMAYGIAEYILPWLFPLRVQFDIPNWILFLLPLTLVDYLYYWNHRLLHLPSFWFLHRTHHSPRKMDFLITSRNSVWTIFFLVYLWMHVFLIYFCLDSQFYIYGMYLHGVLDMLRHSGVQTVKSCRVLGRFLILPEDHEWHHARHTLGVNFGANLNIWDRMHGTFYRSQQQPKFLGTEVRSSTMLELFLPWKIKDEEQTSVQVFAEKSIDIFPSQLMEKEPR